MVAEDGVAANTEMMAATTTVVQTRMTYDSPNPWPSLDLPIKQITRALGKRKKHFPDSFSGPWPAGHRNQNVAGTMAVTRAPPAFPQHSDGKYWQTAGFHQRGRVATIVTRQLAAAASDLWAVALVEPGLQLLGDPFIGF
jgi:hypothetical protein